MGLKSMDRLRLMETFVRVVETGNFSAVARQELSEFTSDAGNWARQWIDWPGYRQFWTQVARTTARPPADREVIEPAVPVGHAPERHPRDLRVPQEQLEELVAEIVVGVDVLFRAGLGVAV